MVGRRRAPAPPAGVGGRRPTRSTPRRQNPVPDIYREMLADAVAEPELTSGAGPSSVVSDPPQPPKRKRPGVRTRREPAEPEPKKAKTSGEKISERNQGEVRLEGEDDNEEDLEFEDVPLPEPPVQTQTTEMDSDDEEDDDIQFEDVDAPALRFDPANMENFPQNPSGGLIELNLTEHVANESPRKTVERRRAINREERNQRIEVHKMHILCLMSHVSRRNRWCNDEKVQDALRPLLSEKIVRYLNPGGNLSQFGRSESLKNGMKMIGDLFHTKFHITERGMKRTLWAEDPHHLETYKLAEDLDSAMEKSDFLKLAGRLEGSRDVGAQLFCALLRSAGVEARLVCSIQPLPFAAGSPTLPKPTAKLQPKITPKKKAQPKYLVGGEEIQTQPDSGRQSFVGRMGSHTRWLNYEFMVDRPTTASTPKSYLGSSAAKAIKESAFPIYWVEVLDVANQKWQPADPIVTCSCFKAEKFEPPASDRDNCLTYAIAFNEDGSARDVTRRYAKAYNSKTRRIRLEGLSSPTPGVAEEARNAGERWLRRVLRHFRAPGGPSDLDQIEDNELNRLEAREPMPRNLTDFKDHPIYALERHMRRHEVLVPGATSSGTVGAGSKGPLERIYRRRDVRVARSRMKWYRLGRVVNPGEVPVKMLPPRPKKRSKWDDDDEKFGDNDRRRRNIFGELETEVMEAEEDEEAGTPIFTLDQTSLYIPSPVVDGRVPKNKFGNLDVFVPSMVPAGGVHVEDEMACRAAYVLDVDYAPALVGFQFRGRQGTAVLRGVVVAKECEEAVLATVEGFRELEAEMEREARQRRAWRVWKRFLTGLRLRERLWRGVEEEDGDGAGGVNVEEGEKRELVVRRRQGKGRVVESESEDEDRDEEKEEEGEEEEEEEGDNDDGMGGGFMLEDGDVGGGGFVE